MFRASVVAVALVAVACGGEATTDFTVGTIGSTVVTRASVTTTTVPPEPINLESLVISINRMPSGWVQVDDMSGTVGLEAFDEALLDGLSELGIVSGYRSTFARSATSELGALARAGAELVVSVAVEMESVSAAEAGVDTIEARLGATTMNSRTIRTPGAGIHLELAGGVYIMVWSVDSVVQIVVANGAPATNIVNIVDLVPELG